MMKLKLKQSNSVSKHFQLPPILNFHPNRYTPRANNKNSSLPKISPSTLESKHTKTHKMKAKTQNDEKRSSQNKVKNLFQKNGPFQIQKGLLGRNQTIVQDQEANITSNFKRQVQRNLQMIKKEKEQHKKKTKIDKTRYNTPRNATIQPQQLISNYSRPNKCYTEEDDVFAKLNQIIINSQQKSIQMLQESRSISHSVYATNKRKKLKYENSESMIELQQQILESEESVNNSRSISQVNRVKGIEIKNQGNYHEWRKLSIDSDNSKKINYQMSSFEMETDRLQKIRSKNQLSLKKYIQGKNYLRKLANFRDYSLLLLNKDRY